MRVLTPEPSSRTPCVLTYCSGKDAPCTKSFLCLFCKRISTSSSSLVDSLVTWLFFWNARRMALRLMLVLLLFSICQSFFCAFASFLSHRMFPLRSSRSVWFVSLRQGHIWSLPHTQAYRRPGLAGVSLIDSVKRVTPFPPSLFCLLCLFPATNGCRIIRIQTRNLLTRGWMQTYIILRQIRDVVFFFILYSVQWTCKQFIYYRVISSFI